MSKVFEAEPTREQMHLRLSSETSNSIKAKAKAKGMSVSNYISYLDSLNLDEMNDKIDMVVQQFAEDDVKGGKEIE